MMCRKQRPVYLAIIALLSIAGSFDVAAQTQSISATVNGAPLVISASTSQFAGAISSITYRGQQYINTTDHGRELQSASSFDAFGECFNPTEAGSSANGSGATSSSILQAISTANNVLQTRTQMAFWLSPGQNYGKACGSSSATTAQNTTVVSNHILTKSLTIGLNGIPNLIGYDVSFYVPEGHTQGVFEAETAYMPPSFNTFLAYDKNAKSLTPLAANSTGNTAAVPVIVSTSNGANAMAIVASGTGSAYTNFYYEYYLFNDTAKQGCVFYESNGMAAGSTFNFSCPVAIGTVDEVIAALNAYPSATSNSELPVYRFRYTAKNAIHHFYTQSYSEGAGAGFQLDGTLFRTFPSQGANLVAIYRCNSPNTSGNDHFLSTASNCEGFNNEGSVGFISAVAGAGLTPLYRFHNAASTDHLMTTNYSEGTAAGYTFEGTVGYVP